jgi:4'-phosphopantetheinyl transferase
VKSRRVGELGDSLHLHCRGARLCRLKADSRMATHAVSTVSVKKVPNFTYDRVLQSRSSWTEAPVSPGNNCKVCEVSTAAGRQTQTCDVWWATLSDVRPGHVALLDDVEHARRERYLRTEDRDRFTLGVAVSRLVLGPILGLPPERVPLNRDCPDCGKPHGRPVVAGGPQLSVSHSGDRVAVAFAAAGPVGVDVEAIRPLDEGIERHVLAPTESAAEASGGFDVGKLLSYWTRKEAIVKATGDGLRAPMRDITVSAPAEPPRLVAWPNRAEVADRITLHTLDPGPGYFACLALIDQPDAAVREHPAGDLLSAL